MKFASAQMKAPFWRRHNGVFRINNSLAKTNRSEQAKNSSSISWLKRGPVESLEPQISAGWNAWSLCGYAANQGANRDHGSTVCGRCAHAGSALTLAKGFHITTVRGAADAKRIFFVSDDESG